MNSIEIFFLIFFGIFFIGILIGGIFGNNSPEHYND